jgi:hypothetical protein
MPGVSDTCETCERLAEELRIATLKVFEAEQALDAYELNPEFDPKDSKRDGELRLAVKNAQEREADVARRQAEHHQTAHP